MMEASPEATPEVTGETADEATAAMAAAALQNAINCESDPEALQTLFTPGFVMAAGGYDSIEAAAADGFFGNSPLADAEVGSVTSYSDGTVGINIQYFATQYQVVSDKWVLADVDGEWKFDGIRDGDPANVDGDQAAVGVNLLENGDGTYAIAANKESVVATDVLILQAINAATNLEGHELVVVQLPEGADPAGIIDGSITEDDVTFIGQVTVAAPGDSTDMTLVGLPAGQYTLLCAFPGPDGKPIASPTDAAVPAAEPPPPEPPVEPTSESPRLQAKRARRQELVERFDRVHELHKKGYSAVRIARELGLSRRSVFRYLQRQTCPAWHLRGSRRSRLDGHREWIDARIAEGLINVADLHRQLSERGFEGSYGSVYAFVTKRLGAAGKKRERLNAAAPPVPRPPSARQLSFEWVRRPEKRKPPEQARLDAIRGCGVEPAAALDLADGFADLIRKKSTETLSDWLVRGEASSDPDLRRFAEGIRRDESCVQAAVTERWSNGPVEGHVNRLKTIKRQMYGRAGFVLLRARVLNAA